MGPGPSGRPRPVRAPLLAAALAFLLYLPTITGGFLDYDDPYLVRNNPAVREAPLTQVLDPRADRAGFGSEYLPLRDLTYALDARVVVSAPFPLPHATAVGFRLHNLLWYALACALAALVFERLVEAKRSEERAKAALLAALLFAAHPAHAESVAWIAGRKDVVSGALALACVLVHLHARGRDHLGLYAVSAGLGFLACMAKSTATALPFLLLAVEVLDPGGRGGSWRRRALRTVPTLAVCGAAALIAVAVGRRSGISQALPWYHLVERLPGVALKDLSILRHYLAVAAFPVDLRLDQHELLIDLAREVPRRLHGALSLAALAPLAYVLARGRRPLRFAGLWFLAGLLPVLNIIPLTQWLADRFLFLPLLGTSFAAAWLFSVLARRQPELAKGLALFALILSCALTYQRGMHFRDPVSLWQAELSADPESPLALRHLAGHTLKTNDPAVDRAKTVKAARQLERALDIFDLDRGRGLANPGHEQEAALLLAEAWIQLEDSPAAIRALLRARAAHPGQRDGLILIHLRETADAVFGRHRHEPLTDEERALFLEVAPLLRVVDPRLPWVTVEGWLKAIERADPAGAAALREAMSR